MPKLYGSLKFKIIIGAQRKDEKKATSQKTEINLSVKNYSYLKVFILGKMDFEIRKSLLSPLCDVIILTENKGWHEALVEGGGLVMLSQTRSEEAPFSLKSQGSSRHCPFLQVCHSAFSTTPNKCPIVPSRGWNGLRGLSME